MQQAIWPNCINHLAPFACELNSSAPLFVEEAWNQIRARNHSAPFPIRIVSLLGKCKAADYPDCPTLPKHHKLHVQVDGFYPEGLYSWIDFDFVWRPHDSLQLHIPLTTNEVDYNQNKGWSSFASPMRMVFHMGDWDCNDGCWGVVWSRDAAETIATIENAGHATTTIKATSKAFTALCEAHLSWMSGSLLMSESLLSRNELTQWLTLHYANKTAFEKAVGLAIVLAIWYKHLDTQQL